jgi:OOP family OmpA-OmpF porin
MNAVKLHLLKTGSSPTRRVNRKNFKLVALKELHQDILEKNMKKVTKTVGTLGLVGCAVFASPFAIADNSGWYIGGNIGQSRAKIDDALITANLLGASLTTNSITDDNRDPAYKIFGGYQLNKNLAFEAGLFNLGQFGFTANTTPPGTLSGNIKLRGLSLDTVGILPLTEKFSVFGRLGLNYAQAKDSFTSTGAVPTPVNPSPSKSAINYKAGLGLQYDLSKSFGLRLEAERYRINDAVGSQGDINLYSLGMVYRFGNKTPKPTTYVEPVASAPVACTQVACAQVACSPVACTPQPAVVVMSPPLPRKVVFSADSSADSLFDFGKTVINPIGQRALDKFAVELKGAEYSIISVTGHTDRIGSHASNLKLSERRAEAVKKYLVESAGVPASKITARGVNGSENITKPSECIGKFATKKLIACLAPDRRVEVEVTGTRSSN